MIRLLSIDSNQEKWFSEACTLYENKIPPLYPFERLGIKSSPRSRQKALQKVDAESEALSGKLRDGLLVICDEKGKSYDSLGFSQFLVNNIESGSRKIDFVIGGAFGLNNDLKNRAHHMICLSPFVLNHMVAQVVLMEQFYRGLSIWKGLPYHNS